MSAHINKDNFPLCPSCRLSGEREAVLAREAEGQRHAGELQVRAFGQQAKHIMSGVTYCYALTQGVGLQ